jgi:hypothetical protein
MQIIGAILDPPQQNSDRSKNNTPLAINKSAASRQIKRLTSAFSIKKTLLEHQQKITLNMYIILI